MELVKGRELKDVLRGQRALRHRGHRPHPERRSWPRSATRTGWAWSIATSSRRTSSCSPDGTAKVADFGIAHLESSELTQVGTVLGTPAYMSPEQILGLPVDGRSDLFSVGVILYQFLTGERPFTGNATITMRKVLEEEPLPPSRFNVQIPGAMDAVVRRALAKKAEERFPSADEFAAALAARTAAEPGPQRRAPPCCRAAAAPTPFKAAAGAPAPARPSQRPAALAGTAPGSPSAGLASLVAARRRRAGALTQGRGTRARRRSRRPPRTAPPATQRRRHRPRPSAAHAGARPAAAPRKTEPGTVVISAVGAGRSVAGALPVRQGALQSDLRADSRSQLVEKAVGMLVEHGLAGEELRRGARQAAVEERRLRHHGRARKRAADGQGRPRVAHDRGGGQREGRAEVAERDVAQRAHRLHPREWRSARRACAWSPATPMRPARRRSSRRPRRTS